MSPLLPTCFATNFILRNLSRTKFRMCHRYTAFTIVELLTVVAIIILIIGLTVPSMKTMRSHAPLTGATQVANLLALARQKAVSSRSRTAMVFSAIIVGGGPYATNSTIHHLTSYTVLQQTNVNAWIYLDRWQHLPAGAYFSQLPISTVTFAFPTNGGPPVAAPAIEFTPRGERSTTTTPSTYTVMEGNMDFGWTNIINSNALNIVSGTIYRTTGAVRVFK